MKAFLVTFSLLFVFASPAGQESSPRYFRYTRNVTTAAPNVQNYIVVDQKIWQHSRQDLADIRLYAGDTQVPYSLQEEKGGASSEEEPVKILNLGMAGNAVQFDLDLGSVPEYDRIRLELDAKDFVSTAQVEGRVSVRDTHGTKLGHTTLYDFTQQKLGSNSILQLPASSFGFLHVTFGSGIRANQVKSAYVFNVENRKASWTNAGVCQMAGAERGNTVLNCSLAPSVPVDRILFQVNPEEVNFRRPVTVTDASGSELARGQIERIKIARQGQSVISENLALDLPALKTKSFKITVQNGDDAPLPVVSVEPTSIERRAYFNPAGNSALKLYFGDEKLTAPDYDYAKFFREEPAPVQAQLGPILQNPSYTERPDDRPWSERHRIIVWLAMLLAVGVLAVMAIRGFKSSPRPV